MTLVMAKMQEWPECSDNDIYPVPHPTLRPMSAYMKCDAKWDGRTAYGRARRRMCDWLADEAEKVED